MAWKSSFPAIRNECTTIGTDHFAAIVQEAHPLAQNKSLAFTDTLGYDHVGLSGIEFRILEDSRPRLSTRDLARRLPHGI